MTYHEKTDLGRRLLDQYGLHDWRFDIQNIQKSVLFVGNNFYSLDRPEGEELDGVCLIEEKTILVDGQTLDRSFKRTVLHEIAHALLGRPGHDKEFHRVHREVKARATEMKA